MDKVLFWLSILEWRLTLASEFATTSAERQTEREFGFRAAFPVLMRLVEQAQDELSRAIKLID